jgi:tetratricopeptide (TPR) repeat protein
MSWKLGLLSVLNLVFVSCVTPNEKVQMQDDIGNLQGRLVAVEQQLNIEVPKDTTKNNRNMASINSKVEKQTLELQKMMGEIDSLKVGVRTGQLPGQDPSQDSVAKTLSTILSRIDKIEANQKEIVAALDAKESTKKKNSDVKIKSLKKLRKSFAAKRYKDVVASSSYVYKKMKSKTSKLEVIYIEAESLYKLGQIRESALKYNEYLEMKPKYNIAKVKNRLGDCFRQLGDKSTARLYYQEVVSDFKGSKDAKIAKERLAKL